MKMASSAWKSGMVIAGRGARACDMCGKERARWYCSADEAYLCERCDGSVHSANPVARRHDRVKLGPNGAPMKIDRKRSDASLHRDTILPGRKWHRSSKKRSTNADARGPSPEEAAFAGEACMLVNAIPEFTAPASLIIKEEEAILHPPVDHHGEITELPPATSIVKSEPVSPSNDHLRINGDHFDFKSEESEVAHEVPTYEPLLRELIAASHGDLMDEILPASPSHCNHTRRGWGDEEAGRSCKVENVPDTSNAPGEVEAASVIENGSISINDASEMDPEMDTFDVMDLCTSAKLEDEISDELQELPDSMEMWKAAFGAQACSMFGGNPFKGKGERQFAEETVGFADPDWCREGKMTAGHEPPALRKTISLRLNYEEVLNEWSDRGSLWMDGQRPQIVPDDSFLESGNFDAAMLPDSSSCNSSQAGEHVWQVPVLDCGRDSGMAAREARVMRYREKRQTRLFSKKIRYEVRKLNAERRPRMKGRFVKRSTIPSVLSGAT